MDRRLRQRMRGQWKPILSAVLISLTAVPPAFAHGRALPAGPEWYVDDSGLWHSLREDWRNLQHVAAAPNESHRRPHRHHLGARHAEGSMLSQIAAIFDSGGPRFVIRCQRILMPLA